MKIEVEINLHITKKYLFKIYIPQFCKDILKNISQKKKIKFEYNKFLETFLKFNKIVFPVFQVIWK